MNKLTLLLIIGSITFLTSNQEIQASNNTPINTTAHKIIEANSQNMDNIDDTYSKSNEIEANLCLTITINTTPTQCIACIGAVDITVSGGTPPYSFNWSNGTTTEDQSGLCTGNYTLTVTDATNCVETRSISVSSINTFGISQIGITKQISCYGACNGVAMVSATGGQPPYNYLWVDGTTTDTITGLCQGAYPVTVSDQNGCKEVTGIFILNPPNQSNLVISFSNIIDPSCITPPNGMATVIASGGEAPYTYSWNTGETTATALKLLPGLNQVTVNDNLGCSVIGDVMLSGSTTPLNCDLSPIMTLLPSTISGISTINVVVNVTELNAVDSDANIIAVRIPSDSRLSFNWDSTFIAGNINNTIWDYSGDNGIFHAFMFNLPTFQGATSNGFSFTATYDPQNTSGTTTMTATIVPFSGGECNLINNTDSETLVYFD